MDKTVSNLRYQFLGQGSAKVFALLFYIFLARQLGEEDFGRFNFALVITFIFAHPLSLAGQDLVLPKWVSRGKTGALRLSLKLWVLSSSLACAVVVALSLLIPVDKSVLYLLLGFTIAYTLQMIYYSYLRGKQDMRLEGISLPIQKALTLSLLFILPLLGLRGPQIGALSMLLPGAGATVIIWILFREVTWGPGSVADRELSFSQLLKEGSELTTVALLWMVYYRVDSFMLGLLSGPREVGIYNAAYRLLEGIYFVPTIIMIVYFPKLAIRKDFRRVFKRLLSVLSGLGLSFSAGVLIISPLIIEIIYAGGFTESVKVLRILSFALFFVFAGHLTTQALVALDMNRTYLVLSCIAAIINIFFNYLVIPAYGAEGAAGVTVATEAFMTAATGTAVWKKSALL